MTQAQDKKHRQEGARIFRSAINFLKNNDWEGTTMDLLLSTTPGRVWPQPMAVYMYSELYNELAGQTLSQFDKTKKNKQEVIKLFEKVIKALENE
jgi:hypothetical protein